MEFLGRAASELENTVSSWIGGILSSAKSWVGEWDVIQPSAIHLCGYTALACVILSMGTLTYFILQLLCSRRLKRKPKSSEGKKGSLFSPVGTRKSKNAESKSSSNRSNEDPSLISVQITQPYISMAPNGDAGRLVSPMQTSTPSTLPPYPSIPPKHQPATYFPPAQNKLFGNEWLKTVHDRSSFIPNPSPTPNTYKSPISTKMTTPDNQMEQTLQGGFAPLQFATWLPPSSLQVSNTNTSLHQTDEKSEDEEASLPDSVPRDFAPTENILALLRRGDNREESGAEENKADEDEEDEEDESLDASTSSYEQTPHNVTPNDTKKLGSEGSCGAEDAGEPTKGSRTLSVDSAATHSYHVDIASHESESEDEIMMLDRLSSQRRTTPPTIVLDEDEDLRD